MASSIPEVFFREEDIVVRFEVRPPGDAVIMEETLEDMMSLIYLVSKVYSQRTFSAGAVKANLQKIWCIPGDFKVTDKGNNLFMLGFEYDDGDGNGVDCGHPADATTSIK